MRSAQGGMTLLEALVALALMALIGAASYQVLAVTLSTRDAQARHRIVLSDWQRAFSLIQRDVEQAQPRPVRSDGPEPRPALVLDEAEQQLELTTGGRSNPLARAQSPLSRIRYRIGLHPQRDIPESPYYRDEQRYLLRESWFNIDGPRAEPADLVQALLPEPDSIDFEVLSSRGRHRQWPPVLAAGTAPPVPLAILVSLGHPRLGVVQRSLKLPDWTVVGSTNE